MAVGTWVQPHKKAACIPVTQDPARGIARAFRLLPASLGCSWSFPTADQQRGGRAGPGDNLQASTCLLPANLPPFADSSRSPRSACNFFFFFLGRCLYSGDSSLKHRLRLPSRGNPAEYSGAPRTLPPGPPGRCGARPRRAEPGAGAAAGGGGGRCEAGAHRPATLPRESKHRRCR